ncbi:restriction endonuclease subunit S [uncultured Roseibium sp.]|uniref:restriction endonuclease subunit S n=1 Tax=uncultured Roseibium sp. TaxID=1936171 RepID=UPI002602D104|nr:restriction endonuclease subunit S [uncultured Roseibium sp.]
MVPDGWQFEKLGNFIEFKNGMNAEKSAYGSGVKFVNVMDVFAHDFLHKTDVRGSMQASEKQRNEYSVIRGDILFNRTSETFDEIAMTAIYTDDEPIVFGGFVIRGRQTKKLLTTRYSGYCFQPKFVRRELIRRAQGAVRANIGQKDLGDVQILVPPLHEQERIAEILSTWDRAVQATEKLIANCQAQKKALMQQLLTGKNRYSEFIKSNEFQRTKYGLIPQDWNFVQIGSIADEISERNVDGDDFPVLSCTKYDGFVSSLEYFKKKVFSDDTSNYKLIKYGQFGFPSNHIEEGSIGLQDIADIGQVSPIYCVFQASHEIDNGYLYKLLKTEHYRQIFAAFTNASVDRRGSLRWREFSKIYVPLPTLPEQRKISKSIDSVIEAEAILKTKLAAIQREKTALMQQLLTGKRRVKIEEVAA